MAHLPIITPGEHRHVDAVAAFECPDEKIASHAPGNPPPPGKVATGFLTWDARVATASSARPYQSQRLIGQDEHVAPHQPKYADQYFRRVDGAHRH